MIDLAGYTPTPLEGLVALALILACITDLRTRRIPNELTLPLWGIGAIWHMVASLMGSGVWWTGLLGILILFPIHFVLFALGIDKGGDAKLMVGVAACLGWWIGVEATIWGILLMLPVSLVMATFMGKLPSVWRTLIWVLKAPVYRAFKLEVGPAPEQTYMAKAPVIALAVVLARLTTLGELWLLGEGG